MERRSMLRSRLISAAAIAVIAVLSLGLAACGSDSSTSTSGSGAETGAEEVTSGSSSSTEGVKVGYFTARPTNAYIGAQIEGAQNMASEYGMDLTVVEASFEPAQQIEQMQQAMQRESFDYWMAALNSGVEECGVIKAASPQAPPSRWH